LSQDATRAARVIACVLSLVMTGLSLHLMVKHRQAELRPRPRFCGVADLA